MSPHSLPTSGADLRRWRESQGIDRAELAALVDASAATVANWELGRNLPRGASMRRLQEVVRGGLSGTASRELIRNLASVNERQKPHHQRRLARSKTSVAPPNPTAPPPLVVGELVVIVRQGARALVVVGIDQSGESQQIRTAYIDEDGKVWFPPPLPRAVISNRLDPSVIVPPYGLFEFEEFDETCDGPLVGSAAVLKPETLLRYQMSIVEVLPDAMAKVCWFDINLRLRLATLPLAGLWFVDNNPEKKRKKQKAIEDE